MRQPPPKIADRPPPGLPTLNRDRPSYVSTNMSILKKLFASKPPAQRVRVCIECGMPLAEHKDWCSIYRTQQEMNAKRLATDTQQA